jgi:hypothetical protein
VRCIYTKGWGLFLPIDDQGKETIETEGCQTRELLKRIKEKKREFFESVKRGGSRAPT